jgi:hypothetical protein
VTPPAGRRTGRAAAGVTACLALVLTGCDTGEPVQRSERSTGDSGTRGSERPQQSGPSTTIEPTPLLGSLSRTPPKNDASALASQLELVESVLRDPDTRTSELRTAGEFEQLAGRLLALGPTGYAEAVLGRLPPEVRVKTRAHLEAAALLDGMGGPVPDFPDWRIVEPPPAQVLLGHYRDAARQVGVPWEYLAAVHLVETRMGRIRGVSTAGARGPMQFLPTTWDIYGEGGDITDPRDAIFAAARLLRANGAPGDTSEALWHYNPSDSYVGAVTRYARQIERSPSAYAGYWHWRVIYKHVDGPVVLDIGYPQVRPQRLG